MKVSLLNEECLYREEGKAGYSSDKESKKEGIELVIPYYYQFIVHSIRLLTIRLPLLTSLSAIYQTPTMSKRYIRYTLARSMVRARVRNVKLVTERSKA